MPSLFFFKYSLINITINGIKSTKHKNSVSLVSGVDGIISTKTIDFTMKNNNISKDPKSNEIFDFNDIFNMFFVIY